MKNFRNLCLIPAKGLSTRLPKKNLLPLKGRPLVAHSIRKALKSELFDCVCVSTESAEIADVARQYGADIPFFRPDTLSVDPATIVDVMLHTLERYQQQAIQFDYIWVLLPTAPFLLIEDLFQVHQIIQRDAHKALMSVTRTEFPPYNAWIVDPNNILSPCFPTSPYASTKSTECPAAYRSNGAVLVVQTAELLASRGYRHLPITAYVMPPERSIDIDTFFEYEVTKLIADANLVNFDEGIFDDC